MGAGGPTKRACGGKACGTCPQVVDGVFVSQRRAEPHGALPNRTWDFFGSQPSVPPFLIPFLPPEQSPGAPLVSPILAQSGASGLGPFGPGRAGEEVIGGGPTQLPGCYSCSRCPQRGLVHPSPSRRLLRGGGGGTQGRISALNVPSQLAGGGERPAGEEKAGDTASPYQVLSKTFTKGHLPLSICYVQTGW